MMARLLVSGMRTKIYSMFHEMLVDIEDFNYMNVNEFVAFGKSFVEHYRKYDVLNYTEMWYALEDIKLQMDKLYENDCISEESVSFIQGVLGYKENWELGKVYEGFCDDEINAYVCAQKHSIMLLGEKIKNYSGFFETYCRQWFMPGLTLGVNNDFE